MQFLNIIRYFGINNDEQLKCVSSKSTSMIRIFDKRSGIVQNVGDFISLYVSHFWIIEAECCGVVFGGGTSSSKFIKITNYTHVNVYNWWFWWRCSAVGDGLAALSFNGLEVTDMQISEVFGILNDSWFLFAYIPYFPMECRQIIILCIIYFMKKRVQFP